MLGQAAFSEFGIAEAPTTAYRDGAMLGDASAAGITPTATAGAALGLATVAAITRTLGTVGAAGNVVGAAVVVGQTFPVGTGDASRNQLFDFSVNILQALFWQYNTAPNLTALLEAKQEWYDENQEQFWRNWFQNVFNIPTANDFGCSVWAIILGIPLNIFYPAPGENWGFGPFARNFDRGNFAPQTYEVIPLTIQQKRMVLQLRYYQLITRGQIPDINRALARIFGALGQAYVLDGLDMTMTYVFNFTIPSQLAFILKYYNLLPQPAGVEVFWVGPGQSIGKCKGAAIVFGQSYGATKGTATGAATVAGVGAAV